MPDTQNTKIVIAAHKPYWMPDDSLYLPVQVGSLGQDEILGFQRDDSGENISDKNSRYCELTALYWAWKNLDCDYLGLVHYRRHFAGSGERNTMKQQDVEGLLSNAPVILPEKRRYFIETVASHYSHTFDSKHLEIARDVISMASPEMVDAFDNHMSERSAHIWNMMVMEKNLLNQWCDWLFPILGEIEKQIAFEGMTPFEERVIGRVSERLLDPWLDANKIDYIETPVVNLERTNWVKKVFLFLMAKYGGKKYQKSL